MGEEILNLSTIVDPFTVNIASSKHKKGKLYDLIAADDLAPVTHAKLGVTIAITDRLNRELFDKGKLTAPQQRELSKAFDEVINIISPSIEPAVLAEMSDAKKERLIRAWVGHNQAEEPEGPTKRPTTRS